MEATTLSHYSFGMIMIIDCLYFSRMYQLLNFWVFYIHNIFQTVFISYEYPYRLSRFSFSSLMCLTVCMSVQFLSRCLAKQIALFISFFPKTSLEMNVLGFSAFVLANLLVFLCSATDLSHSSKSRNFFFFLVRTASYVTSCHHQVSFGTSLAIFQSTDSLLKISRPLAETL